MYDLIIVGGGIVGLTCANLCSAGGLKVALVTESAPDLNIPTNHSSKNLDSIDLRCSAIGRAAQNIFQKIDLWEKIQQYPISPYEKMRVWDGSGFGEVVFSANEVNEPDLGHIIENRVLVKVLWEKMIENENITVYLSRPRDFFTEKVEMEKVETEKHEIEKLEIEKLAKDSFQSENSLKYNSKNFTNNFKNRKENITLVLSDNTTLTTQLLIGADGANSWVRTKSNLSITKKSYNHTAIVANVKTTNTHQKTAWQRFLPEGPLAFLPLSDPNTTSIVWSTLPEKAQEYLALSNTEFCEALTKASEGRLGFVTETSKRIGFPLERLHAHSYISERVALIGDAAHVVHPLAGQGVNLGIQDAATLATILIEAHLNNTDLGHSLVLRKYERSRKGPNLSMMWGLDFFKKLFQQNNSITLFLRSFGLNIVNRTGSLKKFFIRQALL